MIITDAKQATLFGLVAQATEQLKSADSPAAISTRKAMLELEPELRRRKATFDANSAALDDAEKRLSEARRMVKAGVSVGFGLGVFLRMPDVISFEQGRQQMTDVACLERLEAFFAADTKHDLSTLAKEMNRQGNTFRQATEQHQAAAVALKTAEKEYGEIYFVMQGHLAMGRSCLQAAGITDYSLLRRRRGATKKKTAPAPTGDVSPTAPTMLPAPRPSSPVGNLALA